VGPAAAAAEHRAACYWCDISMRQVEVSHTLVFDAPRLGAPTACRGIRIRTADCPAGVSTQPRAQPSGRRFLIGMRLQLGLDDPLLGDRPSSSSMSQRRGLTRRGALVRAFVRK
jgi:hypothetical protein